MAILASFRRSVADFLTRGLDAGSVSRRWPAGARLSNLNSDVLGQGRTVRERAAYYAANNAHGRAAVAALVSNIVGPGIVPSPQHPDPTERARLAELWLRWTDQADFDNGGDFYALQALAVRQMVETGESFAHLVADGATLPLSLRLLHPSQIPTEWTVGNLVNQRVRGGVEFDEQGRRVAYWALPFRPDDPLLALTTATYTPVRLPAAEVLHLFDLAEPGQIRGLSWFAPVLLALRELDEMSDAALVGAKVRNLICAAMIDPEGSGGGLPGDQAGGVLDVSMEPGAILPFQPGRSIEFFDPKESTAFGPFVKEHLRAIAAGLGLPYELLTGDLSSVNYSSIRAGLVEFRKRLAHFQHNIVVFRFCRPVWDRFIGAAVLAGLIDPAQYARNTAAYHAVNWIPPKSEWVDPQKDITATLMAIEGNLVSRDEAIIEQGRDPAKVRAEIAAAQKADEAAGLRPALLTLTKQQAATDAASTAKTGGTP